MTGARLGARRLGAAALVLLAGCAGEDSADSLPAPVPVDSALVDVLADIGLAEARTGLAPPERQSAVRDSLRTVALDAHGMRASDLERAQARLAGDPATARATYDAVDRRLSDERYGAPQSLP